MRIEKKEIQIFVETSFTFCRLADREIQRDGGEPEKAALYAQIAIAHAAAVQAAVTAKKIADSTADKTPETIQFWQPKAL